ncbi:hypothetical protein J7J13_01050 [bacterium]|nr:hypothetical protein [bacterium]
MQNEIKKFLQLAISSKEASLAIAGNEKELEKLENKASEFGFQKTQNVREIFNAVRSGDKAYFVLKNELGNNIYNILAQYPTGQINAYDGNDNLVANPNYQTGAVLILITEENLNQIEKSNKSLLKLIGLTWRK